MIKIIGVTDGRPGHEKQTKGLITALEKKREVQVRWMKVPLTWSGRVREVFQLLFPAFYPADPTLSKADLVLCTGSKTHLQGLLLKRKYGLPVCVCMNPSVILRRFFDYCFVPQHDKVASAPNIVATFGPPNPCVNKKVHNSQSGLILLGGIDEKSHHWDTSDVVDKIRCITGREPQTSWVISSSPRTPGDTVVKIQELVAESENQRRFFDFKDTPPGWIEGQYETCQKVWVTADSMSMIYEALSSGCKVGLLPLCWRKGGTKFKDNEQVLIENNLVSEFKAWFETGEMVSKTTDFNEAQRCVEYIVRKWWPKN